MSGMADDDYWCASTTKAFSFEDENPSTFSFSDSNQTKSTYSDNTFTEGLQRSFIPINSIISQQCLQALLGNDAAETATKSQSNASVTETISKMLLQQEYSLDSFRSLQRKEELLDAAINVADGNAILAVVLFLAKTLKKSLFYKILSTRAVAVEHYVNYLSVRLNTSELTDLLMMTGYSTDVGIKLFKIIVNNTSHSSSVETLLRKLQSLCSNHYSRTVDDKDGQIIKNYITLLEWQVAVQEFDRKMNVLGLSVNKSLELCCKHHWGKTGDHICSPQKLTQLQNASERQMQWIFLNIKSAENSWDDILKMFIKNNWFGNKKVLSTSLNTESIIMRLGEREAPSYVLEQFLTLIEDSEKALALANKFKCHRYVINYYVSQKDKAALLNYKSKMPPQSEDFYFMENALCSTSTKWKS